MDATILTVLGIITAFVSAIIGAFIGGLYTLRAAKQQIEILLLQVRGDAHERIFDKNQELLECLLEYPLLKPYFYDNRPVSECQNEEDRARIEIFAEMFALYLELTALNLPDLPDTVKKEWELFVIEFHNSSPAIRE